MKSTFRNLGLILGMALVSLSAHAKDEGGNAVRWLTEAQEQALSSAVPPPPKDDQADLAAVIKAQTDRTPAIIAECKLDQKFSYSLFASVYGTDLTEANSPKFIQMLKDTEAATRQVNGVAKKHFMRGRPYVAHAEVKSLFTVKDSSYPSGHSMGSYTLAIVLGAIFPDKKQIFLDRAAQIAQSRVNAGVHYPSDIAEGEVLGKATGAAILANPTFQADLKAVQAELKK